MPTSFKPEVRTGVDPKFYGNNLAFATREEAETFLAAHWTIDGRYRVIESDQPVNYKLVDGVTARICPHCARDLEGDELITGLCTSDDCPRHDKPKGENTVTTPTVCRQCGRAPDDSEFNYYLITGRLHGDDEDTALTFFAASEEGARKEFHAQMIENLKPEELVAMEEAQEGVYITTVARSVTVIEIL